MSRSGFSSVEWAPPPVELQETLLPELAYSLTDYGAVKLLAEHDLVDGEGGESGHQAGSPTMQEAGEPNHSVRPEDVVFMVMSRTPPHH